jgi:hypothetical protein
LALENGTEILRKVENHLPHDTESHPKRHITSHFEMSDKFMDFTRKALPQELLPLTGNVKALRNI